MTLSVYLSNDVRDVLQCYGKIDDVVNKILVAGSQGMIDIMEKPAAPEKKGGTYHQINIREPDYISLLETYGVKSSRISLRRLLYWFVENEIYYELGWEPSENFIEVNKDKRHKSIIELKQALFSVRTYFPEYRNNIDEFRNFINEIEEEIWYAK